jgi:hypothetical protein
MRMATSENAFETAFDVKGLGSALERWLRPAVGFDHPLDVVKDPHLDLSEKRAVLASWASDASSVRDEPGLRWLLGTPEPVPLDDVREAVARLDGLADRAFRRN